MQTEPRTDEQLMLAFTGGNAAAFEELFHRYVGRLHGFFARRIADRARAEELAQDTLLAVYRAGPRYEPRALFRTYVYAVGYRILRAERRRAAMRALFFLPGWKNEPACVDSVESSFWMREAIALLEVKDREVLLLREFEQLSYVEIAQLLRLPINTVRSRLFRARGALREVWLCKKVELEALRSEVAGRQETI